MDRKTAIAEKARELFNAKGTGTVSLRDIAEASGIAYGNLTYHFPRKEDLVRQLYLGMMEAHRRVSEGFRPGAGAELLQSLVRAPIATFSLTLEYLFLFRDFAEIMRDFPEVAALQRVTVEARKAALAGLFGALQAQGLLRKDLEAADIAHLMDMSGAMRTFFFMGRSAADWRPSRREALRKEYVVAVNRLLYPYLTRRGAGIWRKTLAEEGYLDPENKAPGGTVGGFPHREA
jgi:AcrR family transcriptional regulator